MTTAQHDHMRADAQQNRDRILAVARAALAAASDASLNSIAKKAGVGPGTLYRHFPNREALVLAVYQYEVQQLADAAPALLSDHDPVSALRLWLGRLARSGLGEHGLGQHGLANILHAAASGGLPGQAYGPVVGAIRLLMNACAEAGSIRPGVDPRDVVLLIGFLGQLEPGDGSQARADRLLDLVVAGLRVSAPEPQPVVRRLRFSRLRRRQDRRRRSVPAG
jgi:AcrR family transcriptional regulator